MTFFLVVDSLWVLVLLMFLAGTIVTARVFLNGSREEPDSLALEALAHAGTAPAAPAAPPTVSPDASAQAPARAKAGRRAAQATPTTTPDAPASPPTRAASRRAAARRGSTPAAWPGGDCPNCGSETVPSAKFCGECGHRLTP